MPTKLPTILAIIGSERKDSANQKLMQYITAKALGKFNILYAQSIYSLPYFNPDLTTENVPQAVEVFRQQILEADGVIICTPEYVFSIPGVLKNAIEWCVSVTLFTQKKVGLITAAANGQKAHEQLQLIMQTLGADLQPNTTLPINGIKGKINGDAQITNKETENLIAAFIDSFLKRFDK